MKNLALMTVFNTT